MKVSVFNDDYSYSRIVRLDYYLSNGEHRVRQYSIGEEDIENRGINYVAGIVETLKAQARKEVYENMVFAENYQGTGTSQVRYWQSATKSFNSTPPISISAPTSDYTGGTIANDYPTMYYDFCQPSSQILIFKMQFGRHKLSITKEITDFNDIEITQEDIDKAKAEYIKNLRINIITRRVENRAEDLLKMFISEVDFKSYKKNGYFMVKSGNRAFRIYKDYHKHIDYFEKDNDRGLFIPKNRLCVHTPQRDLPFADEALAKLMLIRSGQIIERSNLYSASDLKEMKEEELVLI